MQDNTSLWSVGLPFIQWALNTTYHEVIKIQPYEAVFGHKAQIELKFKIPQEFLATIKMYFRGERDHGLTRKSRTAIS